MEEDKKMTMSAIVKRNPNRDTMSGIHGKKAVIPFYTSDTDRTALLYCDVEPILEKYSAADVCIICDVTGSMLPKKDFVHDTLGNIMDEVAKTLSSTPRFAFIGFRDKEDKEQIIQHDFTLDVEGLKKFIKGIECTGGVDDCEDLVEPMKRALKLSWRSDCLFVYIVLDAPTHGKIYQSETTKDSDNFPNDDKLQLLEKLCDHYKQNRINIVILMCNSSVDMTIQKMRDNYDTRINKLTVVDISGVNGKIPEDLCATLKRNVSQSLSKSIYSNFRKIKPALKDPERTSWGADQAAAIVPLVATIYAGSFIERPYYEKMHYKYSLNVKPTVVGQAYSISASPLEAGTFKTCYQLYSSVNPKDRYVGKIPKETTNSPVQLMADIEGNVFASHFALQFNTLIKQSIIKILPLVIMEITNDAYKQPLFAGSKCFLAQRFLDGEYVKYNNNYGWVNPGKDSKSNRLAQAFSHYTYEASMGTLIIVDIQGVVSETNGTEVFTLTDPAIHSALYKGHFGDTNHGKLGFMKFFETHVCNDVCKELKLTDPKLLSKDTLATLRAQHQGKAELAHVYGDFEKNFERWLAKLRDFDPKKHNVLAPIAEETKEDDDKMSVIVKQYNEQCDKAAEAKEGDEFK